MRGEEVVEALLDDLRVVFAFDLDGLAVLDAQVVKRIDCGSDALLHDVAGGKLCDHDRIVAFTVVVVLEPLCHDLTIVIAHRWGVNAEERRAGKRDVHRQNGDIGLAEDVHDGLADGCVDVQIDDKVNALLNHDLRVGDAGGAVAVVVRIDEFPAALLAGLFKAPLDETAELALFVDVAEAKLEFFGNACRGIIFRRCGRLFRLLRLFRLCRLRICRAGSKRERHDECEYKSD